MPHVRNCRLPPFLLTLALLPPICLAQQDAKPLPEFEVAVIKPVDSRSGHMEGINVYPGGRLVITGFYLKTLIHIAFGISFWQISGGEEWISQDAYDVEAKAPDSPEAGFIDLRHTLFTIEDVRLRKMLQTLLIDRFQLKFHRESKDGAIYLLQRTGKPLGLVPTKRPKIAGEVARVGGSGWRLFNTSMPQLARFAGDLILHKTVLDQTGVDGSFDFVSKMIQTDADLEANDPTDSFLSLLKKIGLQLKPSRGPIETFFIDHATKPAPN